MPEDIFEPTTAQYATDKMVRDWLRKPFKPEQIGKLPATQKRPALDFVGHAAVTDRLNKIAPDWHYTVDELFSVEGKVWIRGTMVIGGIARPEYGDGDDPKEAIGNFIRRGAMRFGVAIDLWSREELGVSREARVDETVSRMGKATADKFTTASLESTSPSAQDTAEHSAEVQEGGEESSGGQAPPAEAAVGGNESFLPESSKPPGRRYQFTVGACAHGGFDENDRCLGCGAPASRIERVTT